MNEEQLSNLKKRVAEATTLEEVRKALDGHRGELWSEDLEAVKGGNAASLRVAGRTKG